MRFLSLCSGIEAASVAWAPMGWKAAAVAEIEAFPSAVLAHHYPDVPNLGDITKFKEWPDFGTIDLICGGTPCQSFSIAGLRKGLADPRGNLSLTFLAIIDRYRPRYVIWENVPGVLSDDGGRSFASIVGGLGQLGYGWAYRVLDAQYVRVDGLGRAVPQRRRRVVVVGYLGDWRRAAAVLSEPESVLGDTPPRRETREGIAAGALAGTSPGGGWRIGPDEAAANHIVAEVSATLPSGGNSTGGDRQPGTSADTAGSMLIAFNSREDPETTWDRTGPLGASSPQAQAIAYSIMPQNSGKDYKAREVNVAQPLMAGGPVGGNQGGDYLLQPIPIDMRQASRGATMTNNRPEGRSGGAPGTGIGESGDPSPTIASSHIPAIAIQERAVSENLENGPQGKGYQPDLAYTLEARNKVQAVASAWAVRRLMPVECERLMGFPDFYTAIQYRGKPAADGPRYKSLGNSWAVNVFRWVGRRIQMVEQIAADLEKEAAA